VGLHLEGHGEERVFGGMWESLPERERPNASQLWRPDCGRRRIILKERHGVGRDGEFKAGRRDAECKAGEEQNVARIRVLKR
jgi:hypothetical protein